MAKISKPVIYTVVLGVIAYGAVVLTEPDAAEPTKAKPKVPSHSSAAKATEYIQADYEARFAALNQPAKNAFKPVVVRANARLAGMSINPNGIPPSFANGDPNWAYTGLVEVNGEKMALLENGKTGEGEYLRRGDHWRGATIKAIGEENLVIVGADGAERKIQLGARDKAPEPEPSTETEVVPVQPTPPPALQGEIGMNMTTRPGVPVSKKG